MREEWIFLKSPGNEWVQIDWFEVVIRLSEGVLFSIIYNLLQFFPIARRFHLILNRNPPIRHAR